MSEDEKRESLLTEAKERLEKAYSADIVNRDRMESDFAFVMGDGQWREVDRIAREAAGKPCLTLNRMPQFLRRVTAQVRNLNPAIRVTPGDGAADKEVAEVIEGMIRQIENASRASSIYEGAAECAAACSIGYWRILTKYEDGDSFNQEICLEPIRNPFAVFFDPEAKDPTRKDARYGFIAADMALAEFKEKYPKATAQDITGQNTPKGAFLWRRGETVTVAEYYWIEDEEYTIGLMPDGSIIRDPKPPLAPIKTRTVLQPKVKWAKISGSDVLEGPSDVVGRHIPIVAVVGEEWHVGEQVYRSSVIRFAKDAQVLYNYARSVGAEVMGAQTMSPWLVTAKQVAGFEAFWQNPNKAYAYLPYTPDPAAGAPQRIMPAVPSSAVMAEIQMASEDMKATTGIFDASLGARSNETSGVAIAQRQQESEASTSSYADNMVKAIAHTGDIIVNMIPQVYDTERVIRILGPDGEEKIVEINRAMETIQGWARVNDLTAGKYAVHVSVGPSYQSKREEGANGMMEFLRSIPNAAPMVADLVAKAQDWPDSDRIAERLKKTLPPGIADDQEQPSPEQQQMQMQQMQMQQEQIQAGMQMQALQMQEAEAKAQQAQATAKKAMFDARKAEIEAAKAELELATITTGPMPGAAPVGAFPPFGA